MNILKLLSSNLKNISKGFFINDSAQEKTVFMELTHLNGFWYGGLTARLSAARVKMSIADEFCNKISEDTPTLEPHIKWWKDKYLPQEHDYIGEILERWESFMYSLGQGIHENAVKVGSTAKSYDWKAFNNHLFFEAQYASKLGYMLALSQISGEIISASSVLKSKISTPHEHGYTNRWRDYLQGLLNVQKHVRKGLYGEQRLAYEATINTVVEKIIKKEIGDWRGI